MPILAEMRLVRGIGGGEGTRGGLLVEDDSNRNALQMLAFNVSRKDDTNGVYPSTLKRLREMDIFVQDDINRFDLLQTWVPKWHFCDCGKERFHYLANWDPDALRFANHSSFVRCGNRVKPTPKKCWSLLDNMPSWKDLTLKLTGTLKGMLPSRLVG